MLFLVSIIWPNSPIMNRVGRFWNCAFGLGFSFFMPSNLGRSRNSTIHVLLLNPHKNGPRLMVRVLFHASLQSPKKRCLIRKDMHRVILELQKILNWVDDCIRHFINTDLIVIMTKLSSHNPICLFLVLSYQIFLIIQIRFLNQLHFTMDIVMFTHG